VAWRVYDGEAVIVSPDDSTLHTLNVVGTVIWEAADGKTSLDAAVARIVEEFEVEPEVARRDALGFIEDLRQRGLLSVLELPQKELEEAVDGENQQP
jgi:hypothetical protein